MDREYLFKEFDKIKDKSLSKEGNKNKYRKSFVTARYKEVYNKINSVNSYKELVDTLYDMEDDDYTCYCHFGFSALDEDDWTDMISVVRNLLYEN